MTKVCTLLFAVFLFPLFATLLFCQTLFYHFVLCVRTRYKNDTLQADCTAECTSGTERTLEVFKWREEDRRGRIILAPYVFCIQFTCKGLYLSLALGCS